MKATRRHTSLLGLLLCLTVCQAVRSEDSGEDFISYKPSWKVGQTWQVDVETLTTPFPQRDKNLKKFVPTKIVYGFTFKAEDLEDIEGESCYVVRAEAVSYNGERFKYWPQQSTYFWRFYFRVDDYALKRLERVRVFLDEEIEYYAVLPALW